MPRIPKIQHTKHQVKKVTDPIVAYDLYVWVIGRTLLTVMTSDRAEAQQLIWDLHGPYTNKDVDIRPISASERDQLRARKRVQRLESEFSLEMS